MIITKKALSRRTVLRGLGAALALPLLDSMAPALSAATKPVKRFGAVYVPNGMLMQNWTPAAEGPLTDLPRTLQPLSAFKDRMLVLTGLSSNLPPGGGNGGIHARSSTRFLTDTPPRYTQGSQIEAGISIDQMLAKAPGFGAETQLGSLEVGLDGRDFAGSCDIGYSCAYNNTISWRTPTLPLPMENNPRVVFERLFGDSGSTDPAVRLTRIKQQLSILDAITEKSARIQRRVGAGDNRKLDEYLEAVREVERRIQKAEEQNSQKVDLLNEPAGIPATYEEHAKLMFDLNVLAYQTDITRVITMMLGRELSGRAYPEVGAPDGHHATSHHQNDPRNMEHLTLINSFHTKLFGYYLEKLGATQDGDGTLLDHVLIIYGAGMSDSNQHAPNNLPSLLVGGAGSHLKGGQHLKFKTNTPLANMHLRVMDLMGLPLEKLGDSSGELDPLPLA